MPARFEEAIATAVGAAPPSARTAPAICIEGDGNRAMAADAERVRLIAPGMVSAILGRDGSGVILSSGGEVLLGPGGGACKSLAVFRLRIGRDTPPAVYVLGARAAGCFEGEEIAADLGFFARALERADPGMARSAQELKRDWLSALAHERRASPHTLRAYGDDLERFLDFLDRSSGRDRRTKMLWPSFRRPISAPS